MPGRAPPWEGSADLGGLSNPPPVPKLPLIPPPLPSSAETKAATGTSAPRSPQPPPGAARRGGAEGTGVPGRAGGPRGARARVEDAGAPRRCPPYIGPLAAPAGCRTWPIHRLL